MFVISILGDSARSEDHRIGKFMKAENFSFRILKNSFRGTFCFKKREKIKMTRIITRLIFRSSFYLFEKMDSLIIWIKIISQNVEERKQRAE